MYNTETFPTCGAVGLIFLCICCISLGRGSRRPPLPPGPRGLPVIGNMFDMPARGDPLPWKDHLKAYGPISSVTVFGQTVIILNDLQTCIDLLDNRSNLYSGRPVLEFAGSLVGWDQQMIMSQTGEHFRKMRKMLKSFIGSPAALEPFHPVQELEARFFLARVLEEPKRLIDHIRLTAGAISLRLSHGYTIETDKPDPLITIVQKASKEFYLATMPGAWLVDTFPLLKYVPAWMPGANFKRVAAIYREHNLEQTERPHNFVKRRMAAGEALPSFTSAMLAECQDSKTEDAIKWAATVIYGGGSDPTIAALSTFFLIMALYPGPQQTARDEIEAVVGSQRLPTFADRPRLPYVEAMIKEVLRWHSTGRLGIPHRSTKDDLYNNYLIPKDSIILPHMWNITHDPSIYSDPHDFRPERFLKSNGQTLELDPNTYIYGFGRRLCPGQEFANASMFIIASMSLVAFDICKLKDANGKDVEPRCEFEGGTVSHPKPFEISMTPRSPDAEALIRSIHDDATRRPSDGPYL